MHIYLLSMGLKKNRFLHIHFVGLKKLPMTVAVEAQKRVRLQVPTCQTYSCHPRIISHGAPFHPQKGFSLDNELYSPSNRGGDRLW